MLKCWQNRWQEFKGNQCKWENSHMQCRHFRYIQKNNIFMNIFIRICLYLKPYSSWLYSVNVFIMRISKFSRFSNEHSHKNTFKKNMFMNIFIEELVNFSNLVNRLLANWPRGTAGGWKMGVGWVGANSSSTSWERPKLSSSKNIPWGNWKKYEPQLLHNLLVSTPSQAHWPDSVRYSFSHLFPTLGGKRPPEHSRTAVMLQQSDDSLPQQVLPSKTHLVLLSWIIKGYSFLRIQRLLRRV